MAKRQRGDRPPKPVIGRVIRAQSGLYAVQTDAGVITAVLRGLLRKDRQEAGLAALGDFVRIEPVEATPGAGTPVEAVVVEVLPRTSVLARRAPGPKGMWAQDVIVANIDQMVPVFAVREPVPHWRMLDRFLALAEIDELASVIVLNKTDLGVPPTLVNEVAEYERIGYRVVRTSAQTGEGIADLRAMLADRVSAVVGPSGTGKSSLLNLVEPGLGLQVGAVSEAVQKGRHTTRVGQLLPLSVGGLVADTPGLREIGMWDVDPGELEWAFVEFRPFLHRCRFYNCTHLHEPDCAVQQAAERGDISPRRYDSYRRLIEDDQAGAYG
jgi:ribosome biogenesis GTPase / thiamine phosphate phosphatase